MSLRPIDSLTYLNGQLALPAVYQPCLDLKQTEDSIKFAKDLFERRLAKVLNLTRASAPLMVFSDTGINDHLNGVECPIRFPVKAVGQDAEIVQSLAKWKRMSLADYGFRHGEGLYTDMNAIRPDEMLDNLHSIYVDQWDWERVIADGERTVSFLKKIVRSIYQIIQATEKAVCRRYPQLPEPFLPPHITFIHSEDLAKKYPNLSPRERENAICKEKRAVFIIGIGAKLADGSPHDGRAADYDDWVTETGGGHQGLNGDILVWYPPLNGAFELSSMGIRVSPESLFRQLKIKNELDHANLYYHRRLLKGELPLSIGGGIGQSRLCMFYLRKIHIGEVQASVWPEETRRLCAERNIPLL